MIIIRCKECNKIYKDEISAVYGIENNSEWLCERHWNALLKEDEKQ